MPLQADVHILFRSDYYEISDFRCKCLECTKSEREYQENFSLCFIRKGNFYFNAFKNSLESHTGFILINKPLYEYTVTHVQNFPDECTILTFKNSFYTEIKEQFHLNTSWFFGNPDMQSLLLKTNPELDYMHQLILTKLKEGCSKLEIDSITMELLQKVLADLSPNKLYKKIPERLKKNHLLTIEKAKEYIGQNFTTDISLAQLAEHCFVSPFHFSRIFKAFSDYAPYKYLQELRLKHAETLLKTTSLPVTDIAFSSGFNSTDYFSAAFKSRFKISPSSYRTNTLV